MVALSFVFAKRSSFHLFLYQCLLHGRFLYSPKLMTFPLMMVLENQNMQLTKMSDEKDPQEDECAKDPKDILLGLGQCVCEDYAFVTHCIFDMDGLMLDTEKIYEDVYNEIAQEYGKTYTKELKLKIMGRPEPDGANIFVTDLGIPLTGEQFLAKFKPICMERLQNPKFLPGVVKLVRHLAKNNIPMAVATSSHEDIAKIKTQHHKEIFNLFHHMVCGSSDPEVKRGKPAPDIYLVCADRFPEKPQPEQVLVFEDAPNGVEGAFQAGMQCVMVPAREFYDEFKQQMKKKTTITLKSLELFIPELFNLPAFEELPRRSRVQK